MCKHGDQLRARPAAEGGAAFRVHDDPLLFLDDSLNRLGALLEAVDWLLTEPPDDPTLVFGMMVEVHRAYRNAARARDALFARASTSKEDSSNDEAR